MSTYAVVKDLLQVLIVPISLAVFGYYWPLWLARTKRDAFEEMIWREMDEMNPLDRWIKDPDFRWWQLLPKRFVHERIFLEPSSNREFVLSLTLRWLTTNFRCGRPSKRSKQSRRRRKSLARTTPRKRKRSG